MKVFSVCGTVMLIMLEIDGGHYFDICHDWQWELFGGYCVRDFLITYMKRFASVIP